MFNIGDKLYKDGNKVILDWNGDEVEGELAIRDGQVYILSNAPYLNGANMNNSEHRGYDFDYWIADINPDGSLTRELNLRHKGKGQTIQAKRITASMLDFSPKRDEAILEALEYIRDCDYGGTAIKLELEAELFREYEWDEDECNTFIQNQVSDDSKKLTDYAEFYEDGSVDSELTYTISIRGDDMAKSYEAMKDYIHAFKALADEIGNGMETEGAGMHISVLNSEDGNYPGGNSVDSVKTGNFMKAMTPLMPAFMFLASCDYVSRGLHYRAPRVARDKYNAIHISSSFEYRAFETCYQDVERLGDYLVVIAQSLQFYKKDLVVPAFMGKIGKLGFNASGEGVGRFYVTADHMKALYDGLKILKPNYYTIEDLKKQRNFKGDLKSLETKEKTMELEWRKEYEENAKTLRKQRREYLRNLPAKYNQWIQSIIGNVEYQAKSYPKEMWRSVFSTNDINLATLIVGGHKDVAEMEIKKHRPYEQYRSEQRRYAPPIPERNASSYVAKKKEGYKLQGGSYTVTV